MALRATIFKANLHIADTGRHHYDSHALTIARHPSETEERMMMRLLAFALHAEEGLALTRGLSQTDEPDVWLRDLTGVIRLWVEIGQPDERRLLKACGRADQVIVYCYGGHASQVWWDGVRNKLARSANLRVVSVAAAQSQAMARLAERSMELHYSIEDGTVLVTGATDSVELELVAWR